MTAARRRSERRPCTGGPAEPMRIVGPPFKANDASLAKLPNGYAVAYRALAGGTVTSPRIRVHFLDSYGRIIGESDVALGQASTADARRSRSPTTAASCSAGATSRRRQDHADRARCPASAGRDDPPAARRRVLKRQRRTRGNRGTLRGREARFRRAAVDRAARLCAARGGRACDHARARARAQDFRSGREFRAQQLRPRDLIARRASWADPLCAKRSATASIWRWRAAATAPRTSGSGRCRSAVRACAKRRRTRPSSSSASAGARAALVAWARARSATTSSSTLGRPRSASSKTAGRACAVRGSFGSAARRRAWRRLSSAGAALRLRARNVGRTARARGSRPAAALLRDEAAAPHDRPLRLTFRDVPLAHRFVFYGGLYYEHERMRRGAPVHARVLIDGREVGAHDARRRRRLEAPRVRDTRRDRRTRRSRSRSARPTGAASVGPPARAPVRSGARDERAPARSLAVVRPAWSSTRSARCWPRCTSRSCSTPRPTSACRATKASTSSPPSRTRTGSSCSRSDPEPALQQTAIDRFFGVQSRAPAADEDAVCAGATCSIASSRCSTHESLAFRFPGMLSAGLLLWLILIFGARLYGRRAGMFAALAFALLAAAVLSRAPRRVRHADHAGGDRCDRTPTVVRSRSAARPLWCGVLFGLRARDQAQQLDPARHLRPALRVDGRVSSRMAASAA